MGRSKATPVEETEMDEAEIVSTAPEDWEWETVSEESATTMIFEEIGDTFIGEYLGTDEITFKEDGEDKTIERFVFRARNSKRYAVAKSYNLVEALSGVEIGQWTRIQLMNLIPTGRKLNPMKDFRVDVKK